MSAKVISIREGTCRSVQNRLDAFRNDELTHDARRFLLRHLLGCASCLRELQIREQTEERIKRAVYGQIPPRALANRIIDLIRAETVRVTPWPTQTKNLV
jgi:hypothetical protein